MPRDDRRRGLGDDDVTPPQRPTDSRYVTLRPRGTLSGMAVSRIAWPAVAAAYCLVVAGAVAVRLQMASGFGFEFLGFWKPPNSPAFQEACGISSLTMLGMAAALVVFVLIRGQRLSREAAAMCPFVAVVLYWLVSVV